MRFVKRLRLPGKPLNLPERRLKLMVLIFLLGIAAPLYILFDRVYAQLRLEALHQYRLQAEHAVGLVDDEMTRLLTQEARRPFADYGFFRVEEQKLLQTRDVALSPLAAFPIVPSIPGLIGYFQISPEGVVSSPVLPDITQTQLKDANVPFSEAEYNDRLALKNRLEHILQAEQLPIRPTPSKREDAQAQAKPSRPRHARPSSSAPSADAVGQAREAADMESAAPAAQAHDDFRNASRNLKLEELNFDKRLYERQEAHALPGRRLANELSKKGSISDLKRQRKERIDVPESQSIEAYRAYRSKSKPAPKHEQDAPSTSFHQPLILSFEGEIDPFQLYILQDRTFVFARKAWKAGRRYIQGFIVDGRALIQQVMQPRMQNSSIGALSRWVVGYHDEVLEQLNPAPYRSAWRRDVAASQAASSQANTLIYKTSLSTPLHDLTVHVTVASLPLGPGAAVAHVLAVVIPTILLAGAFGLYRLASQQIKLAAAQHNFVSAVSHELRTPLTSIRMYGEMLRAGWVQDEDKRQTYYDFIFFESERLSRLVANVLQLSRLTHQSAPLDLQVFSPAVLLDAAQASVQAQVEAAGFTLEVSHLHSPEQGAAQVEADEDAFTRIIINLVDNALKFAAQATPKVVRLSLDIESHPRLLVTFAVRDYGPGIERQHRNKIFQRFYRAGSELTRATPGTGIGLALVKELAHAMRAEVEVRTCQPGAEFRLVFRPVQLKS